MTSGHGMSALISGKIDNENAVMTNRAIIGSTVDDFIYAEIYDDRPLSREFTLTWRLASSSP
jgi:hypothetical protein